MFFLLWQKQACSFKLKSLQLQVPSTMAGATDVPKLLQQRLRMAIGDKIQHASNDVSFTNCSHTKEVMEAGKASTVRMWVRSIMCY